MMMIKQCQKKIHFSLLFSFFNNVKCVVVIALCKRSHSSNEDIDVVAS